MKNKNNDLPENDLLENQKQKRLKKNLQSGKSQQRKLKKQPASLLDENLSSLGVSKGHLAEMRAFQKKKREWGLVIGDRFTSPLMGFQNQIKNATAPMHSMRGMSNMMGLGVAAEVHKLQDKIFNGSCRIPKSYSSAIAGSLSISDTAPGIAKLRANLDKAVQRREDLYSIPKSSWAEDAIEQVHKLRANLRLEEKLSPVAAALPFANDTALGIAGLWNNSLGNFNLNSTMASALAVTGPLAVSGAVARVMEQAHNKFSANFYPAPKSYLFGLVKIWEDDSKWKKTAELQKKIVDALYPASSSLAAVRKVWEENKAALEIFRGQSNLLENFHNNFNSFDRFGRAVKSDFDLDQTAPIDKTAQAPVEKSKQAAAKNHLEEDHRLNVAPPMKRQMDLADKETIEWQRSVEGVVLKIYEEQKTTNKRVEAIEKQNDVTNKRLETSEKRTAFWKQFFWNFVIAIWAPYFPNFWDLLKTWGQCVWELIKNNFWKGF